MRSTRAFQPFAVRAWHDHRDSSHVRARLGRQCNPFDLDDGAFQNRATLVEVAARQRTLAERWAEVALVRAGKTADPARTASLLAGSARALLDGGTVPAVDGDDDATALSAVTDPVARAQLMQEQRLVADLARTGSALLAHRPLSAVPLTAHERIQVADPLQRLRVLAALTSNVALNADRTIARAPTEISLT
jgi:hypothetical protein